MQLAVVLGSVSQSLSWQEDVEDAVDVVEVELREELESFV